MNVTFEIEVKIPSGPFVFTHKAYLSSPAELRAFKKAADEKGWQLGAEKHFVGGGAAHAIAEVEREMRLIEKHLNGGSND